MPGRAEVQIDPAGSAGGRGGEDRSGPPLAANGSDREAGEGVLTEVVRRTPAVHRYLLSSSHYLSMKSALIGTIVPID